MGLSKGISLSSFGLSRGLLQGLLGAAVGFGALGCSAGTLPKDSESGLLNETNAGKLRCIEEEGQPRLFTVEWDATDLARFEAKSKRDIVFVKYSNCKLTVLEGCTDSSVAGRYGTYKTPVVTSGGRESFVVKTNTELASKLPLGAATLGGELQSGRGLQLDYYVASTTEATGPKVYLAELKDNAGCAGATHFVSRVSLGAFALGSDSSDKLGAGVEVAGFGGKASHSKSAKKLRKAGDISRCKEFNKFDCSAPIRIGLTALAKGTPPAAPPATLGLTMPPGGGAGTGTMTPAQIAAMRANIMKQMNGIGGGAMAQNSAMQKLQAGDGAGCLRDLDRADKADPAHRADRLQYRAMCEMKAGKCEQGKKHFIESQRAFYAKRGDPTGMASDATFKASAEKTAAQWCPARGLGMSHVQNAMKRTQTIAMAAQTQNTALCISEGDALLADSKRPGATKDPRAGQMMSAGLRKAAECAGKGGKCGAARRLWNRSYQLFDPDGGPDMAKAGFKSAVPQCAGK